MRILKKKIALANAIKNHSHQDSPGEPVKESAPVTTRRTRSKKRKIPEQNLDEMRSTKTIVKNFGKAIASFALSPLSSPYLSPLLDKEGLNSNKFERFSIEGKDSIEGIDTFRSLLLVKDTDDNQTAACKRVFQGIAEVFIKYFSVNWIYSGRMVNKKFHLKCRFKMLRRIQNPQLFTYLK